MQKNRLDRSMPGATARFVDTFKWSHDCTFTCKEPLGRNAARRLAEKIAARVPQSSQKKRIKMFWVAEPAASGDYKLRCFIYCTDRLALKALSAWYQRSIGYCKILPKSGRASDYITKNIASEQVEYDFIMGQ
jgi:hypothetical protein